MSLLVRFKGGSVCRELSQRHLNRPRDPPSAGPPRPTTRYRRPPCGPWGASPSSRDAPRTACRPVSRGGCDGDARVDPVPRALSSASTVGTDHRRAAAHERADAESELRPGERRLCGGHGAGRPVRPALPAAQDAGRLRAAARDRLGPSGRGAGSRRVHRGARDPGAVHEPVADRCGAAPCDRLSGQQASRHGGDHEHVHLRRGRARPVHRGTAGAGRRVAAAVLDRRRDLPRGSDAGSVDVRGRAARRTSTRRGTCRRSPWRRLVVWPRSSAPRSSRATASSIRW